MLLVGVDQQLFRIKKRLKKLGWKQIVNERNTGLWRFWEPLVREPKKLTETGES